MRDASKHCAFHNDTGHHTNDCYQLKKRIEEAVKSGELAHLIKDIKGRRDEGKKDKEVNMVRLEGAQQAKKARTEPWNKQYICLPPAPDELIVTPVIVEAELDGFLIDRVYMDCGASSKVMYERCFESLSPEIKSKLKPSDASLVGFLGERVHPLGKLTLSVCFRDGDLSRTEELTFSVIRYQLHHHLFSVKDRRVDFLCYQVPFELQRPYWENGNRHLRRGSINNTWFNEAPRS
jgi:hypothetical protein